MSAHARAGSRAAAEGLRPVKRVSLTDSIMERLIDYIRTELSPGDRLPPERSLIGLLGVGRTSLREALRALHAVGVVETRAGEGTFVSTETGRIYEKPLELGLFATPRSIAEIYEARRIIEIGMMELVVERITDEAIGRCRQALEEMERLTAARFSLFLEHDYTFHRTIAEATGNGVVMEMLRLAGRLMDEERRSAHMSDAMLKRSLEFHRTVLSAIERRDAAAAAEAMRRHMDWTRKLLKL